MLKKEIGGKKRAGRPGKRWMNFINKGKQLLQVEEEKFYIDIRQ